MKRGVFCLRLSQIDADPDPEPGRESSLSFRVRFDLREYAKIRG
jgi:hypothetical protein